MNRKFLKKEIAAILLVATLFSSVAVKTVYCENICDKGVNVSSDSSSSRANKYVWYYKEEGGKKYMRLYDSTNEVWVTNWIEC